MNNPLDDLLLAHIAAWEGNIKADDFVEQIDATYDAYLAGGGNNEHYDARWHQLRAVYARRQELATQNAAPAFVTNQTYDNYAKRLQRQMLKTHGRSLSWTSIMGPINREYVVEVRPDGCFVKPGWREAMKRIAIEGATS